MRANKDLKLPNVWQICEGEPVRDASRDAHAPEQVVGVFSGQVQVLCSCAVMVELHCSQGQLRDGRYLHEQETREQLNSDGKAFDTGTVTPQALACASGDSREPTRQQKLPCLNLESHK